MRQLRLCLSSQHAPPIGFARRTRWEAVPLSRTDLAEACAELDRMLHRDAHGVDRRYHLHGKRRVSIAVGPEEHGLLMDMHWALLTNIERSANLLSDVIRRGRYPRWTHAYLAELVASPTVSLGLPRPRAMRLNPRGQCVNLEEIRDHCIERLPALIASTGVRPSIGWGRRSSGRRQSRIRLGSARLDENAIVIHPVLDSPHVPVWVTAFVVHHELCHFAAPPLTREQAASLGEHRLHHSGFRLLEAQFPMAEEASSWTRMNLPALLAGTLGST